MPAFQDASSPVTGFTEPAVKFVEDMKSKGEQVLSITTSGSLIQSCSCW